MVRVRYAGWSIAGRERTTAIPQDKRASDVGRDDVRGYRNVQRFRIAVHHSGQHMRIARGQAGVAGGEVALAGQERIVQGVVQEVQ